MTSDSENDSDKELQAAFSTIKGKLVGQVEKKTYVNNKAALLQTLESMTSTLPWIERMDVTVDPIRPPGPLRDQFGDDPDDLTADGVNNDFKREYKFHRQAQATVLVGLPMLHKLGVPTRRPDDNFAEMVKSDIHMKRVREKLVSDQLRIERSEKAKKLRDLRKYGKKVQQEVKMKRQKEKKEMGDAIKRFQKGKEQNLEGILNRKPNAGKKPIFEPNKRRQKKNEKFGFGGQKKRSKSNSADSTNNFSHAGNARPKNSKGRPGGKGSKGRQNKGRPGKSKRQKMKSQH